MWGGGASQVYQYVDAEAVAISVCASSVRLVLKVSDCRTGVHVHGIQIVPDSCQLVRLGTTLRNAKQVLSRLRKIGRVNFARKSWRVCGGINS